MKVSNKATAIGLSIAIGSAAMFPFHALAADAYSPRWSDNGAGVWSYNLDAGGKATNAWVQDEVNADWYLLDASGNMRVGIFESYGRYYLLDTVRGTGHYGRLLKNGASYVCPNGVAVTLACDTSAAYEGALSDQTISSLKANGVDFGLAASVTGTQHVTSGKVVTPSSGSSSVQSSSGNNGSQGSVAQPSNKNNECRFAADGSGNCAVHFELCGSGAAQPGDYSWFKY